MSRSADGFTLLEMLVALSVLSLAVLALVNLAGENSRTGVVIEERVFAGVIADNRAIEALTSPQPPALGETSGKEAAAARTWRWTRRVRETPEPGVLRVEVQVRGEGSEQVLGAATIFRGTQ
jgi:general secretion pathway protein I